MNRITFEVANRREVTNDYLDFLTATQLLFRVYEERQDVEKPFLTKRERLEASLAPQMEQIHSLARELGRAAKPSLLRRSRDATTRAITEFNQILLTIPMVFNRMISEIDAARAEAFASDPLVVRTINDCFKFAQRYEKDSRKGLGGTLPHPGSSNPSWNRHFDKRISRIKRTLKRYDLAPLLDYFQGLIRCCDDSGLGSWWAPFFLLQDDFGRWAGASPESDGPRLTVDAVLGPFFRGTLSSSLSDEETREELSDNQYYEWQLVGMTRQQRKNRFRLDDQAAVNTYLKRKGYRHGKKWNPLDFQMLFERLYLSSSAEVIAARCPLCQRCRQYNEWETRTENPVTIRKRTQKIAATLSLTIPDAKYTVR